ncbi:hypothetical protein NFX46_10380 [Streptomyces phaeoluteigriseus]|uniref:Secreted protein n=1 Tax=Streptomyces phaeoluteigriseus TaxID=114686 RepID=A0ABY4Z662_9ACTN|nr:hypothetical protein [Streptomyces phaeoluteigriseus]USQ84165.1 hypothetical protein NFX46_10380 [Streptomyces phaeoluteigriseus]
MPNRTRTGALTALATAGLALGTVLAVPAGAAERAQGFLAAGDLPPHPSSSWTADRVKGGVPDSLLGCVTDALPGYDVRHREFRTDLDTGAVQVTVVVGGAAKAKALQTRLNKEMRTCATEIERNDPETEAAVKDYGSVAVEEGARVHGLHTVTSWGATDVHLLSVGRDGRTVTLVQWGQMGDFGDAPVKAFKKTTVTAVDKLR